jgi:hypothetical protein
VLELHVELGVTGPQQPLLEETLEAAAAHLFQRAHQIARVDHALLVARQIEVHAPPERRVAELAAQEVEHTRALLVEVAIEDVDGRLVVLADDGPSIAPLRLAHVGIHVALDAVFVLVATEAVLPIDVLHERREALVEPRMGPVPAGHQITEPLVRQLVGDEIVGGDVDGRAFVEQDVLVHRRRGGVLHAAEDEVAHHHLRVLVPR